MEQSFPIRTTLFDISTIGNETTNGFFEIFKTWIVIDSPKTQLRKCTATAVAFTWKVRVMAMLDQDSDCVAPKFSSCVMKTAVIDIGAVLLSHSADYA